MSEPLHAGHEASLLYAVGRVDRGIRREMRKSLATWKLSVQEYTTLSVLSARPGLSNAQLARRALVTPQSMIEILAKLEKRELVKREADPEHGLILRAELTVGGHAVLRAADPAVHAIQDAVFHGVSAKGVASVTDAMTVAMDNLSQARRRQPAS